MQWDSDKTAFTISDDAHGEERFVSVGMDALGRILIVVYAWRGDEPRIISARGDAFGAETIRR